MPDESDESSAPSESSAGNANDAVISEVSRDELIALVTRAHQATAAYTESSLAGKTLAAQSKLPKLIAENLGAGFGQWDFFPSAEDIVDFAFAYVQPVTEEDLWALARTWTSDEAAARLTVMALIGRDILQHELRRIDVPKLRELVDETRASRSREIRTSLGLEVAALSSAKAERKPTKQAVSAKPVPAFSPASVPLQSPLVPPSSSPRNPAVAPEARMMPKPEFKKPPPPPPPAAIKRFAHPKFGEGVLETQDGVGPDAKLKIKFESGSKTLLARYVTEVATDTVSGT